MKPVTNSLAYVCSNEFMSMSALKRIEIMVSFGYDQMPWWKGVSLNVSRLLTQEELQTDVYKAFLFYWHTGKDWDTGRVISEREKRYWAWESGR